MTGRDYRAPTAEARAELRERGSRFIAIVSPARNETAAGAILDELRATYRDATHLCWAWRLGSPPRERSADAGEPHGTAGLPMLQVLRGAGLSDVVAGVARWFGGVKLGKGGLARAYSGVLQVALAELESEVRHPTVRLALEAPFDRLGAVRRLLRPPAVTIEAQSYDETAHLVLRVERRREGPLREALAALDVEIVEPVEARGDGADPGG